MSAAFTPGPWVAQISRQGRASGIVSESGEGVVNWNGVAKPKTSGHANARLIAAAPDLLEALASVMSWIDNWSPDFTHDGEWPDDEAKARAAILAATGATNV